MANKKQGAGASLLGLTVKKEEDFSEWYTQVILRSELIDYYTISGCYILRPWAYAIWEKIQRWFDDEIKKLGVQNAYFPLLVSKAALETEKSHVEGFAAEVAWVTRSGNSDLAEPVAIRPTSETIMYPSYAEWIRSHRDLPLKLNQWTSVVRWEFKDPVPFLRSREFLWQEGHTAHATKEEGDQQVLEILDLYSKIYSDLLAIPTVKGTKSEGEKFAGGLYTTTVEGYIPTTGRGIQAATSHHLGQNFSKMFKIQFEDVKGEKQFAWQTSWGVTTRSLGILFMVHGDDKGLVLPPRVAPIQVVIVPILMKKVDTAAIIAKAKEIASSLKEKGFSVNVDDRENYNPGWKFNHWELKGVPLRVEFGPKDFTNNQVVVVRRDTGEKETVSIDNVLERVPAILDQIQKSLYEKATKTRDEHIVEVREWKDFVPALDGKNLVIVPWCERESCEDDIKKTSGEESKQKNAQKENEKGETGTIKLTGAAKTLCIPFEQRDLDPDTKCVKCSEKAKRWTLFGRSY